MRLIRCYIDNFKGIEKPKVISFNQEGLTILDGPNGFGKTTIFDVLELCIRGRLYKTDVREQVTEDRKDYIKPFFQNDIKRDVIIKAHFQDSKKNDLIIIKYLSKDNPGSLGSETKNKPTGWDIIDTYKGSLSDFESDKIDLESVQRITQEEIDNFFYPESNSLRIINTYLLFNYIQQEENIYFLKKSEKDKREQLDFLFRTENESKKLVEIKAFISHLNITEERIESKLKNLKSQQIQIDEVNYTRLIDSVNLVFDSEDPFENVQIDDLETLYKIETTKLQDLKDFIENFSIDDYEKSKTRDRLLEYSSNENLIFAYLLSNFTSKREFEKLKELKTKIDFYKSFLESDKQIKELGFFLEEFNFGEEDKAKYRELIVILTSLEKELGTIATIIQELNDLRNSLFEKYLESKQYQDEKEITEECPLCGNEFDTVTELTNSIEEKKENISFTYGQKVTELSTVVKMITDSFLSPIRKRVTITLEQPAFNLDDNFFLKVKQSIEYVKYLEEFDAFIKKNKYKFKEMKATKLESFDELQKRAENLKYELNRINEKIVIEPTKLKNSILFKNYFYEDSEAFKALSLSDIVLKEKYIENRYLSKRLNFTAKLEERLKLILKTKKQYERIKSIYDREIRAYKKEMINKIKIPFYLISGKILKNYPQGMGIFIDFNDSNNRIRFITNDDSDHDVVHHLSAGQLAVVSIAFCFALNKMYRVNEDFKFLAIDDPVQTMDDVNVHSLIEVMRHEFKNYQILLSTHEEDVARYMKYKFEKFNLQVSRTNVQEHFYTG